MSVTQQHQPLHTRHSHHCHRPHHHPQQPQDQQQQFMSSYYNNSNCVSGYQPNDYRQQYVNNNLLNLNSSSSSSSINSRSIGNSNTILDIGNNAYKLPYHNIYDEHTYFPNYYESTALSTAPSTPAIMDEQKSELLQGTMSVHPSTQTTSSIFPQLQNSPSTSAVPGTSATSSAWYNMPAPSISAEHNNIINMLHVNSSNGREARNRAEKNRRDKLNGSIQELSTMVPHVAESPRRVDKTAVLRFSAHGMRIDYVFGKSIGSCHKRVNEKVTDAFLRLLDSFLITVTCRGQMVLVSPSVEQHLGHCQTDLFGQNILNFTHPDDHAFLKRQLIPTDLEKLFDINPDAEVGGEPRTRPPEEEDEIDRKLRADKRKFTIRFARAGPRSEPTTYEVIRIDGSFRRADSAPRGVKESTFPTGLQLIRRARGRDDAIPLHTISGNDIVLVAMVHVIKPPSISDRLLEASKFEYKTRHLIDGRMVQCDQRISIVAGYMADEVCGLSPFTFMHKHDVRWVMVALRQMYDYSNTYGESCYRLMARNGQFIYLRTRGYLEVDRDTNQVRSFVCHNTLTSEEEGKKLIRDMKRKFAVMINDGDFSPIEYDEPAVENPVQLERAIKNLIMDLRNQYEPEEMVSSPAETYNSDDQESDAGRSIKSPLAYITPKVESIKVSIDKSTRIIETASSCRHSQSSGSPQPPLHSPPPPVSVQQPTKSSTPTMNEINSTRPSVVQKTENYRKSPSKTQSSQKVRQISPPQLSSPQSGASTSPGLMLHSPTSSTSSISNSSACSTQQYRKIKDESIESRVPPLPTSADYFDSPNNEPIYHSRPLYSSSTMNPSFTGIKQESHDYINQQKCSPTSTTTTTTSTAFINSSVLSSSPQSVGYYSKSYKNNEILTQLQIGRATSVLKRTHSIEDIDSTTNTPAQMMVMSSKRHMRVAPSSIPSQFIDQHQQHLQHSYFNDNAITTLKCVDQMSDVSSELSQGLSPTGFNMLDNSFQYLEGPDADEIGVGRDQPFHMCPESSTSSIIGGDPVLGSVQPTIQPSVKHEYGIVYLQPNTLPSTMLPAHQPRPSLPSPNSTLDDFDCGDSERPR